LAAKRISDIAKELGIASKVIIQKCLDEGIPSDKLKGHMSVVSAGLEASIREWFSGGAVATAVETKEHLDIEKLKIKPPIPKRRPGHGEDGHDDATNGEHGTDHTAPGHAEPGLAATSLAHSTEPAHPHPLGPVPVVKARMPSTPAAHHGPTAHPTAPAQSVIHAPAPTPTHPTGPARAVPAQHEALAPVASAPSAEPVADVAATPPAAPPVSPSAVGSHPPATPVPAPHRTTTLPPPPPRTVVKPAPMNVPSRPTIVAPAGKKLEIKTPVKLSGPKVVRVEAPEQIDVRAPRRPSSSPGTSSGPPRGGRGVVGGGGGGGGAADDASSRRNKRRAGPAEAAPAARRRGPGAPEDVPVGTGISEQDLIERENRLARAGGYLKQRRREMKAREHAAGERALTARDTGGKVSISAPFTIKELAEVTGVKSADIMKKLFLQGGVMATINSGIDPDKASDIMIDFDIELEITTAKTAEEVVSSEFEDRKKVDERPRAPVVTIMGHVDHGKTSLLDKIRNANVAAGEAGGITQKTSAFRTEVEVSGEKKAVVFFDTPGHEAFTEMRSRGANITDIVVLVVGAPEGVMPQTVESLNHARAAKVPIVVALNKCDSPQATDSQIQKVLGQLAEKGLNPIAWGGTTEVVKTSALKGTGIQELLEVLDLQAQILELKADFQGPARGRVVEASLDEGRGPLATILVQEGELKVGDCVVAGRAVGRIRDMTDDKGKRLKSALPSMPVQISGLDEVPNAGDPFFVNESLKKAQEAAEQRRHRDRIAGLQQPKVTLDTIFSQMKNASVKEILIVIKADVQGSVDVIKHEIERLSTDEVKIRVLHGAVGGITEGDVLLANASKAVIVGFNVIPSHKARQSAEQKTVEIRTYQVIYNITDDVKKAASGLLEPEIREEVIGHAEVRKVFMVSKVGLIAGCYVTDGSVQRDALVRVTRNGVVVVHERVLEQLKRFKDDAKDVRAGMECGMKIVGYDDVKEGDVLECYKKVEVKRTL